jgi:hypothetical protein
MSDTQAHGWTLVASAQYTGGRIYAFAANTAASATPDALTVDLGSGQTGTVFEIVVYRVRNAPFFGASAVVQTAVQSNGNGASAPIPTFSANVNASDAVVEVLAANVNWGIDGPTGWAANYWNQEATPTGEANATSIGGGFTGRTIPWPDHTGVGSSFGTIALELHFTTTAAPATLRTAQTSRRVARQRLR